MNFELKQKILVPGAQPFKIGRLEDAGYDIFGIEDCYKLPILASVAIKTGIATAFTSGWVGLILDRSGYGFKGLMRQAGVIDSGYRGEWIIKLVNMGKEQLSLESVIRNPNAKAIAQVVFVPYAKAPTEIVDQLPESVRGTTGWGSTDLGKDVDAVTIP